MLRDDWEFEYTARDLATAAASQRDFRIARIKVWEDTQQNVMQKIKDSGITITDSVAALLSNMSSGKYGTQSRRQPTVMIDPAMQDGLSECAEKIQELTDLRKKYDAWAQVLSAHPEARLKLDHDDWMFFFGK